MLGPITVSIHVVFILALSDCVTPIPACCFRVSITVAFDIIGGTMLFRYWRCSSQWLPIGILYGAICGCEYPSGSLLLVWIDGRICSIYGPNWLPNSMPLNLFWTTRIHDSYFYGWSINAPTTFCNSTCLAIHVLMWKGTKGQSMITCPFSS